MQFDDWLLALHVLSASALMGAIVFFWAAALSLRRAERTEDMANLGRLLPIGSVAVAAGSIGVLVFGVWLAIALDGVQVWDGWVIAAIILWAIATELGRRSGTAYDGIVAKARERASAGETEAGPELRALARSNGPLLFHAAATAVIVIILVDMIWKPGA